MTDQATAAFAPQYWNWGADARAPRMLHTMIRVRDLDASLHFYLEGFGMELFGRFDVPVRRVSAAYIGYGGYEQGGLLELTHKWDEMEIVAGSFHFAIGVPDMTVALATLETLGAEVETPPRILMPGGPAVAFIKDPDGYSIELIQTCRD